MENADGRSHADQLWKQLYKAALFELNPSLLSQKIADAQQAVAERTLALLRENGHNHSENEALAKAHVALDDLKRIYQRAG